jgi:hypothetical protein
MPYTLALKDEVLQHGEIGKKRRSPPSFLKTISLKP